MDIGVLSLIALIAAIALGCIFSNNVGILCIGFSMIIGLAAGLGNKDLLAGFSTSLFFQMAGVTYLFAVINGSGALNIGAEKIVRNIGRNQFIIPVVFYILGIFLSALGPGAIPAMTIMPLIAIPIATSMGINPIMLSIIGVSGVQGGRMSPLTPDSAVVRELLEKQGIYNGTVSIMICMIVTTLVTAVVAFLYYKGWKKPVRTGHENNELPKLSAYQLACLAGLLLLIFAVMALGWNIGFTGFLIGSVLVIIGRRQDKAAIKAMPWNVIFMVMGVGILMNIMTVSGGVDLLIGMLEKIMGRHTAVGIMGVVGAVMSLFSSGLGVVFPTLVPTVSKLAADMGCSAMALAAAVVVGGTVTGLSPVSGAGALIMAGVITKDTEDAAEKSAEIARGNVSEEKDAVTEPVYHSNRVFFELLGIAFVALLATALWGLTGMYDLLTKLV
jgi:di/tricarboxylate transporter